MSLRGSEATKNPYFRLSTTPNGFFAPLRMTSSCYEIASPPDSAKNWQNRDGLAMTVCVPGRKWFWYSL